MATLVQQTTVTEVGSGTTVTRTLTGVTSGSCLTLLVGSQFGEVPTGVSDDVNGAWPAAAMVHTNGGTSIRLYALPNAASGTTTIAVTYTGISANIHASAQEWSGLATSSIVDQVNGASNAAATTHSHGSITTTQATVIVTAAEANSGETETPAVGFTALSDGGFRFYAQYKISAAAETTDGAFTTGTTSDTSAAIMSLKQQASAAGNDALIVIRRA